MARAKKQNLLAKLNESAKISPYSTVGNFIKQYPEFVKNTFYVKRVSDNYYTFAKGELLRLAKEHDAKSHTSLDFYARYEQSYTVNINKNYLIFLDDMNFDDIRI